MPQHGKIEHEKIVTGSLKQLKKGNNDKSMRKMHDYYHGEKKQRPHSCNIEALISSQEDNDQ